MTEAEYNAAEGIRRSDLWRMDDSAEKFKYFLEHPIEQTDAMAFGAACHKMMLEPEEFSEEYVVAPKINRLTKEGKAQWAAFEEENVGKTVLKQEHMDTMIDMEAAMERCPLAWDLIRGDGQSEVPVFWKDPETGEKCKAKLDRLVHDADGKFMIVDYKTATHSDTRRFCQDIFKMGYHVQAAMYAYGTATAVNLDYVPKFVFVVQEKKAPYAVNVIEVSEEVMKAGYDKFQTLLNRYHECKEADMWPGYVSDVANETELPGWWSFEEDEE